jgi:CRP/FNR family transcriptional regulator, cyclic AMP receptor protein
VDEATVSSDLRRTHLFAGSTPETLTALSRRTHLRRFGVGQVVFTEGEPSDHLFVIRSGRVRVVVLSPRGDTLTLTVLGAGDVLGELSMIDAGPRSASAEAVEPTELLSIAAADVRAAFAADPALLLAIAEELAGTVRRLSGGAADMVFLDLPRRLAKLVVAQSRTGPDGSVRADLGEGQAGVAARLGVTRQSLNRALGGLVRRGWLSAEGSSYVVRDLGALRRFAES